MGIKLWKTFHFPKIHRGVLCKITIDLLYFWDVYDVSLWEKNFGRSASYSCLIQISLYKFYRIKKTFDTAVDKISQARHFNSMRICGFSWTDLHFVTQRMKAFNGLITKCNRQSPIFFIKRLPITNTIFNVNLAVPC